jgi:LPS O-antigen subunit length determinant protein (WzzB/FepE family)
MASAGGTKFDADDIEALAQILEIEKRSHARKRLICLVMFLVSLACLVVVLVVGAVLAVGLMAQHASGVELAKQAWVVQVLAALGTATVSFFTTWWGVQNCLNAIDRTLFAARAKRHHLFEKFLEQIQCAEKKKRVWLELAQNFVS